MDENKRIKGVYSNRDKAGKRALYSWSNLHALYQSSTKSRMMSNILHSSFGDDLSNLIVLDVGCGFGNFLRELVEWGVDSDNCIGTEFLDYIIDTTPLKQGLYTPGMHIPVKSDKENIEKPSQQIALLLAWNYEEAIINKEKLFLKNGGKFLIPIPTPKIISK